jgi:hypothetical protein
MTPARKETSHALDHLGVNPMPTVTPLGEETAMRSTTWG